RAGGDPLREPPRAPMPRDPPLMLCTLVKEAPEGPDWVFEPKLDGLRVLARIDQRGQVELISRNDKPQSSMFPEIVDGVKQCVHHPALLDGEIVCLDEDRRSSFRLLQQRFHLTDAAVIRQRMQLYP